MKKGDIDGAWVAEPWGARIVREANAHIFLDERELWPEGKFSSSLLVCRSDYISNNPETIRHILDAHVDKTVWINEHKDEAMTSFNVEIKKILHTEFAKQDLTEAMSRMELTYDPLLDTVYKVAEDTFNLGLFGRERPDLSGMFDLHILNKLLLERRLNVIQEISNNK